MPNENDNKIVTLADLAVAYNNLNTNKKNIQTAVSDPTASGTDVSFIANISQNVQGVITATKKTVSEATTSAAGLMSSADKTKLNGIEAGAEVNDVTSVNGATGAVVLDADDVGALPSNTVFVAGVKGNAEANYRTGNVNITPTNIGALPSDTALVTGIKGIAETGNYRTGNVNITPENIGALPSTGGTITGNLTVHSNTGTQDITLYSNYDGTSGLYANKDGAYSKAIVSVDASGNATFNGTAAEVIGALLNYALIDNYGTNISRADNNYLRCIKYANGLKRITGLFKVGTGGVQNGATICTVPSSDYNYISANNGNILGFGTVTRPYTGLSYGFDFDNASLYFYGVVSVPEGTYIMDYLYY